MKSPNKPEREDVALLLERADDYLCRGRLKHALSTLSKVTAIDANCVEALVLRYQAHLFCFDFRGQIDALTELIRLRHDLSDSHAKRGRALAWLGEHERAILDFNRAIKLNRWNDEAYSARAWSLYWLGRHEEADADFDRWSKLSALSAQTIR